MAAHMLQQAIHETTELETRIEYYPGAGGTLALRQLNENRGDGHYLAVTSISPIVIDLVGNAAASVLDTTPVAKLYEQALAFVVNNESEIDSPEALIERLLAQPETVSIGIATSRGNHNHMAIGKAMSEAGVDVSRLNIVVFDSASKANNALLSGDLDIVPGPIPNMAQLVEAGEVRPLAISNPSGASGLFSDVPTWGEVGIDGDVNFTDWRGLAGPSEMTAQQVAYWDETLHALTSSQAWEEALAEQNFTGAYLSSDEMHSFLQEEIQDHTATLTELGILDSD